MIQLWLGGKRIDSIPLLREAFASRDEEQELALCAELLKRVRDGFFIPWLELCTETRPRSDEERKQDKSIGILLLNTFREDLLSEPDKANLSNKAQIAIAEICGINVGIVEKAAENAENVISAKDIFAKLENLEWFQNDDVKRTLKSIPPDCLATDTDSLARNIRAASEHRKYTDQYLLNTGSPFIIRSLDMLSNMRLVGYGDPRVHFGVVLRNKTLDLDVRNVKFESVQLKSNGVILENTRKRMNHVDWIDDPCNGTRRPQ